MADQKLTAQTEDTSPDDNDIVYVVIDPTGSPLGRKTELEDLFRSVSAKIFNGYFYTGYTAIENCIIQFGAETLRIGADLNAATLTNSTRKFARLTIPHYTNAEEKIMILAADSDGTDNILTLGGGSGSQNAMTQIRFNTAANDTTVTGTKRMDIVASGLVDVVGEITAGTKTFLIDHPADPRNKLLRYGVVESPRYELIHRGEAQLSKGKVTVNIDTEYGLQSGTFEALSQNAQVMSVSIPNSFTRVKYGEVSGSKFTIEADNSTSKEKVRWLVISERADACAKHSANTDADGHLINEVDKIDVVTNELDDIEAVGEKAGVIYESVDLSKHKGHYRHPEAFGKAPPTRKVNVIKKDLDDS